MRFLFGLLFGLPVLMAHEAILSLGELGSVRYVYDDSHLLKIERLSGADEMMYTYSYIYDEEWRLVGEKLIGDLGEVVYESASVARSPYHLEICEYDERKNLVRHTQDERVREYSYNDLNELIVEDSSEHAEYDKAGNLVQKGEMHFDYDEDHRLVGASSADCEVIYTYDCKGKRDSKTVNGKKESYLYFGANEVATLNHEGKLKALRIPGLSTHKDIVRPIAIETPDAIYAPIHDVQGNIVKLIDVRTHQIIALDLPDPFGRGLSKNSPIAWIFSGKHYDRETDLVYFGHRYYCPALKKWTTPDPAFQTQDLYQYCFNNPLSYCDPDGGFAIPVIGLLWGAGTAITFPIWGTGALITAAGAVAGWVAYEGVKYANEWIADQRLESEQKGIKTFPDRLEKGKEGNQRDGTPQSNTAQNAQFDDAVKEIERKIGKKLSGKQRDILHDEISGKNYGYHDIIEEGYWMFND